MIDSSVAASDAGEGLVEEEQVAPWARARARKTRCCWPPESWPIWRCGEVEGAGAAQRGLGAGAVVGLDAAEEAQFAVAGP
jgi:hypothetical protein